MNFLDERLPPRFWDLVSPEPMGGCWLWLGALNRTSYGVFRLDGGARLAHRVSVAAARGPLDSALVLDHRCRNTLCVNPAHIEQVTQRENTQRNYRSTRTHCAAGHEFTEANTYRNGAVRKCRRCHADKQAARKARLNACREVK